MENLIGIYTIGYSDLPDSVKLENLAIIDKTQVNTITDKQIEIYEISKFVNAFMYKCNMTHHFLMSTKKLPVAYINVCYTKYPLKVVLLYRVFLYFKIDNVDHIENINDLTQKEFSGKFILEAIIGDQNTEIEVIDQGINNNNELYKKIIKLTQSDDMINLVQELIQDVEKAMIIQYKDDDMFKVPDIVIKRQNMEKNNKSDHQKN